MKEILYKKQQVLLLPLDQVPNMKLPKKIVLKIEENKKIICRELGNDFYDWVTNPETEIKDYSVIQKVQNILLKHTK